MSRGGRRAHYRAHQPPGFAGYRAVADGDDDSRRLFETRRVIGASKRSLYAILAQSNTVLRCRRSSRSSLSRPASTVCVCHTPSAGSSLDGVEVGFDVVGTENNKVVDEIKAPAPYVWVCVLSVHA
jgi:hypothetical protein